AIMEHDLDNGFVSRERTGHFVVVARQRTPPLRTGSVLLAEGESVSIYYEAGVFSVVRPILRVLDLDPPIAPCRDRIAFSNRSDGPLHLPRIWFCLGTGESCVRGAEVANADRQAAAYFNPLVVDRVVRHTNRCNL